MNTKEKQIQADRIRNVPSTSYVRPMEGDQNGIYFRADAIATKAVERLGFRTYALPHGLRIAVTV